MVEAAHDVESNKCNARARQDQFLAQLLFGLGTGLHTALNESGIAADEVKAEHQTRESKDKPVQPTLPISQRPSGQEDDECQKELKLRQPDKRAFGEIVHRRI